MSRNDDFDLTGLDEFASELLTLAEKKMPNETRAFLQREGNKLRKLTAANARKWVKKKTGNYHKAIKRGRVYKFDGSTMSIRVYGSSPHAHLNEYGHRLVTKDGKEVGFVQGKRVFERTAKAFEHEFLIDCEEFVDELLDKGLS